MRELQINSMRGLIAFLIFGLALFAIALVSQFATANPVGFSALLIAALAAYEIWRRRDFQRQEQEKLDRKNEVKKRIDQQRLEDARQAESQRLENNRQAESFRLANDTRVERQRLENSRQLERQRVEDAIQADYLDSRISIAKRWEEAVRQVIHKHRYALAQEKRKYTTQDAYGVIDLSEWHEKGIPYFEEKVLSADSIFKAEGIDFYEAAYAFNMSKESEFIINGEASMDFNENVAEEYDHGNYQEHWLNFCTELIEHEIAGIEGNSKNEPAISVESMSGIEYEEYCKSLLEATGWAVSGTATTGDQGVDLIATMGGIRACIQCKRYSSPVGNSAVQEVSAGKLHWNGTHAVVVTNAGFTRAAQQLAYSTSVLLMSHEELEDLGNRL